MSIIFKTDEEIQMLAEPLWLDLVKYSNEGKYGEFTRNFSRDFARAMNQVEAGHQFARGGARHQGFEDIVVHGALAAVGSHGHRVGNAFELGVAVRRPIAIRIFRMKLLEIRIQQIESRRRSGIPTCGRSSSSFP